MRHKNDYSVEFWVKDTSGDRRILSIKYVHKIYDCTQWFNRKIGEWDYVNVYNRRDGKFLKRYYNGNFIPKFL